MAIAYADSMMLDARYVSDETLSELVRAMRGQDIAGVHIHDAEAWVDLGPEGYDVTLRVLMDDPPPGERSWSLDAWEAILDRAQDEGRRIGIPGWISVMHVGLSEADEVEWAIPNPGVVR